MKPFDLDAAKRGDPLVTRDGRAALEFRYFATVDGSYKCRAVIEGACESFTLDGVFYVERESREDLFMAPRKVTRFLNLYVNGVCYHFATEKDARDHCGYREPDLAVAVPIEIEE